MEKRGKFYILEMSTALLYCFFERGAQCSTNYTAGPGGKGKKFCEDMIDITRKKYIKLRIYCKNAFDCNSTVRFMENALNISVSAYLPFSVHKDYHYSAFLFILLKWWDLWKHLPLVNQLEIFGYNLKEKKTVL